MRLDYSDRQTEKELNDLEKRIANLYADAYKSIKVEAEAYFADFESEFAVMQKKHVNGDMSKDEFLNWYHTAVTKGTRYNNLINDFANRITDANKIATTYINDTTPGLYALNANYDAYKISAATGYSFSVYDESTVRRLAMQDEIRLPKTKINDAKDLAYNRQKLNRCVTSGILRGVPVQQIAREFGQATNSGYHSAIRAARTAVTGAQNAGRLDTMYRAKDMGIDVLKEWMATKDNRTRDSHGKLDGERREPEEAFSNKCMMPGDPDGPGAEVWNCRCTMTYILPGINDDDPRETYSEWMSKQNRMASINTVKYSPPIRHTKEEQKALVDYAASKDVRIAQISMFTGDSELLIEQIDAIAEMKELFGLRNIKVSFEDLDITTVAETPKRTIIFNNVYLRNRANTLEYLNSDNYLASTEMRGIASHEIMHIYGRDKGKRTFEVIQKAYYNTYKEEPTSEKIREEIQKNVSGYAYDKTDEIVPEIVAKYVTNPNPFVVECVKLLKEY